MFSFKLFISFSPVNNDHQAELWFRRTLFAYKVKELKVHFYIIAIIAYSQLWYSCKTFLKHWSLNFIIIFYSEPLIETLYDLSQHVPDFTPYIHDGILDMVKKVLLPKTLNGCDDATPCMCYMCFDVLISSFVN